MFYVEITRYGQDYKAVVCDTEFDGEGGFSKGEELYRIAGKKAEGLFDFIGKKVKKRDEYKKRKEWEMELKELSEKEKNRKWRLKEFME